MVVEYGLFALAVVLLIAFIVIWSLHFMSLIYGKYKFHKKSKRIIERDKLPGVSIIKPLMGSDENLMDNLETYFVMDYPNYELLFCVQDANDPSVSIVKHLFDKYPNVDARLFSGGKVVGINPKINNMVQGYDVAKNELILISDAGLKMADDTLYDMVSLMTDKVGLVHQMPFVCDRPGFAGALEKVYFGTCHARMYLFINLIGINCVTGMSCLMRKSVLEKLGGLQKFGNYIAEDYFIAQAYLDNKWIIQLSHQPAMQNSANFSVPSWQKRMIRWCKLRLKLNIMSWLEPIQECFMLGLCTSWTVNFLFGWNSLVFFLIHVLGWFICDYMLLKIVQNGKLPFNKFEYVVSWVYRESICFYLFIKAASNPTVKWRSGKYRLRWGGLAEEIKESKDVDVKSQLPEIIVVKSGENSSSALPLTQTSPTLPNGLSKKLSITSNGLGSSKYTSHKRTNSYSVMINNNNSNSSDMEHSQISTPTSFHSTNYNNSSAHSSTSNLNNQSKGSLLQQQHSSQLKSGLNPMYRSHQHHHSISTPISSSTFYQQQPQLQQSQSSNTPGVSAIDMTKFSDLKII